MLNTSYLLNIRENSIRNCWCMEGFVRSYGKRSWANMRSEFLFNGPTIAELITGSYQPETHWCWIILCNPPMNRVIFVLCRVLVFIINLQPNKHAFDSYTLWATKRKIEKFNVNSTRCITNHLSSNLWVSCMG